MKMASAWASRAIKLHCGVMVQAVLRKARGGKERTYLGEIVARHPEFRCEIGSGKGAGRVACHAHEHAQLVIGEVGEAQGRGSGFQLQSLLRRVNR